MDIRHSQMDRITLGPIQNPVRAFLCGGGAMMAALGAVLLWHEGAGDRPRQIALVLFALSLICLLGVSALYHGVKWPHEAHKRRMQRLDHSMIYVLIAGTYTPIAALALDGWLRAAVLGAVWGIAAVGIAQKVFAPGVRKRYSVGLQIAQGWLILLCIVPLSERLPSGALTLISTGGLVYTVGAIAYVTHRPRLWPRVFSYHEVFHVCVVAGASLHYAAVLLYLAHFGLA